MTSASDLRERVTFQKRTTPVADGYGNFESSFVDQFTVAARIQPLKGTESVMASRLSGVQPVVIIVRSSSQTRRIAPDWRAMDARKGTVFNIRGQANMDEKNAFLDILAEAGVST